MKCEHRIASLAGRTIVAAALAGVFTLFFPGSSPSVAAAQAGDHAAPAHRISMATARRTALERVPGEVKSEELEREHGLWIYSFEIRPTGETRPIVREVNIDADTGKIVNVETEKD